MILHCAQCRGSFEYVPQKATICPACGGMFFSTFPVMNAIIGIPDDIYDGVMVGISYNLEIMAMHQKLRSEGYFKASSWIEKNPELFQLGLRDGFTSVKHDPVNNGLVVV